MQVTISVGGRFWAFYLAQQLLKRGYLKRLITSYPKFEVVKYGMPRDKVSSVVIKELMERGWNRLPSFLKGYYNPQHLIHEVYDRWASRLYRKSDVCMAYAGVALHTLRRARDMGSVTVVERGSSHMRYQRDVLKEEYERAGLAFRFGTRKFFEKCLKEYEEADYISIPSLFVKKTFLENGIPEEKLIHVPFGVHLDEFGETPKQDDVFRIIHVGTLSIRKGVHYLLQAYSELKLPNSELLLVGGLGNGIEPFLEKYKGKYRWVGHVPQKELFKYYSQGSVFVLMSVEEGLALVQPQAMACGLPVVCTTNTGGEDIVRDGRDGFIIPIRDTEALKEKLVYLYENPDMCKEMGRSAKERVSMGFTWDDYGDRLIKRFHDILNKSARP
jgi:glycosyltransferase involved in cell wall biosynthesis